MTNAYDRNDDETKRSIIGWSIFGIIILFLIIIIFGTFYTIPAGYRGVVLTFGKPSATSTGEGINFKIPLIQSVVKMDTRTQKYEAELTAASSDLQDVNTKLAINYHLNSESVIELYRTIGTNYAEKIIYPLEQESNKAATAQFTAVELITKREQVRGSMENILREKLAPRGIIVESISIVDFKFSPSFSQAIENKVTAEQNALAAKNKLEQIKYEAEQRVAQAQGESDAIRAQISAIAAQGGANYLQMLWIQKWDGKVSVVNGGNSIVDLRGINSAGYLATTPVQEYTNITR